MSSNRNPSEPHPFAHELRYERDDMQDEMRAEIEMAAQTPEQEFKTLLEWVLISTDDIASAQHGAPKWMAALYRLRAEAYRAKCAMLELT